jgi:hypothetical protein
VSDNELSIARCHNTRQAGSALSPTTTTLTSHRLRMCWAETWMRDSLLRGLAFSDVHSEFALDTPDDVDAIYFPIFTSKAPNSLSFPIVRLPTPSEVKQRALVPQRSGANSKYFYSIGPRCLDSEEPRCLTCVPPSFQQSYATRRVDMRL